MQLPWGCQAFKLLLTLEGCFLSARSNLRPLESEASYEIFNGWILDKVQHLIMSFIGSTPTISIPSLFDLSELDKRHPG